MVCSSAFATELLKPGDQFTLANKATLEVAMKTSGGSTSREKAAELRPGTPIKVLKSDYGMGQTWYEVETSVGNGWIKAMTLNRLAPPRSWLERLGKPVVLKMGQRLTTAVDSLTDYIVTIPADTKADVLEVANFAESTTKGVIRVRVEVSITQGQTKIKAWANVNDLAQ